MFAISCTAPAVSTTNISAKIPTSSSSNVSTPELAPAEPELIAEPLVPNKPIIRNVTSEIHTVNLVKDGFEVPEVTIKVGDTVIWQNVREGSISKGLVLGTRDCQNIRSQIFMPGDSFKHQFTKKGSCTFVDGIFTTQLMKVNVD